MTKNTTPPDDRFEIRCRKLGHQIPFSYCRRENQGLPCVKTLDCWHIHFRVRTHLKNELTPEEWNRAFGAPPKPKMKTLLDLIEQAKAAKEEDSK
jgi:hypothetical protein